MGVVSAGVHHPHLAAEIGGAHFRCEGQVHLLGDRQCVDVGAQRHHGPWHSSPQQTHHARVGDLPPDLEAERFEVIRHELPGTELAVRELRILVDVAAPCDDSRLQVRGQAVEIRLEPLCVGGE